MLSPPLIRFAFLPPLLLAVAGLVNLAVTAFRLAVAAGAGEAVLMAWILFFVVGLPVAMLLLAVAGSMRPRWTETHTIPLTGLNIPGAGQ